MDVMMLSDRGVRLFCESEGWWSNVTMALPVNFTSQSLCHACDQPVRLGGLT